MARMRRGSSRSARGGRSFRVAKDWTYAFDVQGTTYTLEDGLAAAQAIPLTYSQNSLGVITLNTPGTEPTWNDPSQFQSGAALPAASRQRVYAVEGWLRIAPTTWNAGSEFALGLRLTHWDQDPTSGNALPPGPAYSMWTNAGLPATVAQASNSGYLKEWRMAELVSATAGVVTRGQWAKHIFWQSRRGLPLGNARALYMYMETAAGSVDLRVSYFLRCLMKAPQS